MTLSSCKQMHHHKNVGVFESCQITLAPRTVNMRNWGTSEVALRDVNFNSKSKTRTDIGCWIQFQTILRAKPKHFFSCFWFLKKRTDSSSPPTHRALRCTRRCAWPGRGPRARQRCALASPPPTERQKPAWCWPSRRRPHCLAMETRPSSWPPPHHDPDKTSRLQGDTAERRLAKL